MRKLSELIAAVNNIRVNDICSDAVADTKEDLLRINKEQLYDGKLKTGADLSPTYLDDPYFKTPASAKRYSDWKDQITPNSKRKSGVPNLFITGVFYDSLSISISGMDVDVDSSFSKATDIESKFSTAIFGLGGEYKEDYLEIVKPVVFEDLTEQLNK